MGISKYCNSADKVKMLGLSQHFNAGFIIASPSKSIFWSQGSLLGQIWSQGVIFVSWITKYYQLLRGDQNWQPQTAGECPHYVGSENTTLNPLLLYNVSLLLQIWENNHWSISSKSAMVVLMLLACNEILCLSSCFSSRLEAVRWKRVRKGSRGCHPLMWEMHPGHQGTKGMLPCLGRKCSVFPITLSCVNPLLPSWMHSSQ